MYQEWKKDDVIIIKKYSSKWKCLTVLLISSMLFASPNAITSISSLIQVSYKNCASAIVEEVTGIWPDFLITILCDEWRKCKRAMESSSPRKDSNCMFLPPQKLYSEDDIPEGSSFAAGQRMHELVKDYSQFWFLMDCVPLDGEELFIVFFSHLVFVLLHQIRIFTLGRALPEQPPIYPPGDISLQIVMPTLLALMCQAQSQALKSALLMPCLVELLSRGAKNAIFAF